MATIKTISAALKLVDAKKENLRKAFEDLQSHSSSLSSFNLTWSDLDSYFSSLHSSLQHKFQILQSQSLTQLPNTPNSTSQFQTPKNPPQSQSQSQSPTPPNSQTLIVKESLDLAPAPARAELISLCEKMDGLGLRKYMVERPRQRNTIKAELADALGHAPDAAAMVLGAMEGFYSTTKGDKDIELILIRRSAVAMLEGLRRVGGEIAGGVREKARELAAEWMGKVRRRSGGGGNGLEELGFFYLVAVFGVAGGFDLGELVDLGVEVARFREAVELFRVIGFGERISEIIHKLIGQGKQQVAVRFILEFGLSAKFPPLPLLEEYVKESKRQAKKTLKEKNNTFKAQKEALTKEANVYKSVIKLIEDYKLESEYLSLKEKLMKRLETVEKLKSNRKPDLAGPASQMQQSKTQKLSGSKRPRNNAAAHPATISMSVASTSSTAPVFQQYHPQPAGLLPQHFPPYSGSPAGPYGVAGSTPAIASYAGSSAAGLYGSTGAPFGDPGNLMPLQTQVMPSQTQTRAYPTESQTATGYYDKPVAYGSYVFPPQYYQPYHPQ